MSQQQYKTADLYDEHGEDLAICEPVFRDYGGNTSFHGRIHTLKCFEDNSLVKEQANLPGKNRIMVVDGGASLRKALLDTPAATEDTHSRLDALSARLAATLRNNPALQRRVESTLASLLGLLQQLLHLLFLLLFQQMPLSLYYLQAGYYLFCMMILALGISWALSALNVFVRDIAQLVTVLLQVGFWVTPIFWDIQMMPPKVQWFLKLNPVYYIIQGYRDSFISFQPFWNHLSYTAYYWLVTLGILAGGAYIFKKLKPQFPDVL